MNRGTEPTQSRNYWLGSIFFEFLSHLGGCCRSCGFFFFQRWVVATTVVVVVNMASCYEFLWDKFYFILISCLYCFNGMNVKIEPLMLDVL